MSSRVCMKNSTQPVTVSSQVRFVKKFLLISVRTRSTDTKLHICCLFFNVKKVFLLLWCPKDLELNNLG